MNRSIAQVLSYLLHPAVYPILGVFAVLSFTPYHISSPYLVLSLAVVFIGTYVLPVTLSYLLYRAGLIVNLEMRQAEDRKIPYLIGALCYYFVASILKTLDLPYEAYLYLMASTGIILLHLILLGKIKLSAHLAGLGGFTGLLLALSLKYAVNLLPLISFCILLLGFLGSARLYLKAHNPLEVGLGFLSGITIIFGVVYIL